MKRRVLIHSIAFNPDCVSTGYLYSDIATALRDAGHDVAVLTTTPHFNRLDSALKEQPLKWHIPGILKSSRYKGIKVYHIPQKKFKSSILRLASFVYWHLLSFFTALCIGKIDVIISPSPPLTIGLVNLWIGILKGAKVIYNVQEIYPDLLGLKKGIVLNILRRLERHIYDCSTAVTTIDKVFYDTISNRFKDLSKLHIIHNFVDTQIYRPVHDISGLDSAAFHRGPQLKLLYAGNIGIAQDWATLIETARCTRGKPIEYYIIGGGVMQDYIKTQIASCNLDNVYLLSYQPREKMSQIIAFADVHFIFMRPDMAANGFPSKVYTVMACGKPLLICSPADTPIVNLLDSVGCAKIITAQDNKTRVSEISHWLESCTSAELKAMGEKGLKTIRDHYSKEVVTRQYCDLIATL